MSINKVTLLGNVVRSPEIKYFDNGVSVANFCIATTNRGYTAQNGTVVPDTAEYHNIVAYKGTAKIAEKFLQKGTQIYVEGVLRTRKYTDSKQIERYITEIHISTIELLNRVKSVDSQNQQAPAPSAPPETLSPVNDGDDLPF